MGTPPGLEADHRLVMERLDFDFVSCGERMVRVAQHHELLRTYSAHPHPLRGGTGRHNQGQIPEPAGNAFELFDRAFIAQAHLHPGIRDSKSTELGREVDRADARFSAHCETPAHEAAYRGDRVLRGGGTGEGTNGVGEHRLAGRGEFDASGAAHEE